jgi:crotonobetainyl-CoA:carnitine CoA-transferase CaiB-like acyl-CoA transferase
MGANNNRLWRSLCEIIGREDLLSDARFAKIADRLANRQVLIAELEKVFVTRTADESIERMLAVGIPAGPILDYTQALDSDHAGTRNMVMKIDHPVEGTVRMIGFPVKLSGTPQQVQRSPPLLGADTEAILRELGIDAEGLAKLESDRAFSP